MAEIRQIMSKYDASNIYNVDESGLLFRLGLNRTYLSPTEFRQLTHGTTFQKRKERLTTVYYTNATGSHKLPIKFIGTSKSPRCFQDYPDLKNRYWNQKCAWMDAKGFVDWVQWWYNEVRKVSSGPWCLLFDNCGGHGDLPSFNGVQYVELPPNTTARYQPLDQDLISKTKIKYRALLLRETIDNSLARIRPWLQIQQRSRALRIARGPSSARC